MLLKNIYIYNWNCWTVSKFLLSFYHFLFIDLKTNKSLNSSLVISFIKLIRYSCILYYLDLNASITGKNYFIIFVVRKIAIRKFEEKEIVLNVCRTRAINKRRSFLQARRNLGTNRTNCRALRIYMRWGSTHWSRLVTWHVSREKESKRQDIKDFAIGSNVWRTFLVVGRYGWPVGHASRFAKFRVFMTRSLVAATCQTGTF